MVYGQKGDIVRITNTEIGTQYQEEEHLRGDYGVILYNDEKEYDILMIVDSKQAIFTRERFYKLLKNAYMLYFNDDTEKAVDLKRLYFSTEALDVVGRITNIESINDLEKQFLSYTELPIRLKKVQHKDK